MTITIELSWPERALWPNARPARQAKAAVARQGKNEAYVVTLAALAGQSFAWGDATLPVRIVGHKPAEHGQDRDGLLAACKSRLDGVALALRLNDVFFDPRVEWGTNCPPNGALTIVVGE